MMHPKLFKTGYDVQEGDIVLFLKKEGLLNGRYQFGMIKVAERGRDRKTRTAVVKYRNHNETFDRETHRELQENW